MERGEVDDDTVYTANGAIAHINGVHAIAKTGSLAAMTLTPPTADEEGMKLIITSRTAFAHTVTITEGIGGKGAAFDTLTFAAVGDTIELLADNLHWVPTGAPYGVVIA
jgi:hypothetical protein